MSGEGVHLTPGLPIRLSDTKMEALERALSNLITDRESQSAPLFESMQIWEKNYEAEPRSKQKDFPFKNASNLVVPIIKTAVNATVASTWGAVHSYGSRVWHGKTQNEEFEKSAAIFTQYLNWQADGNDFDFGPVSYDAILEMTIHGSAVLAPNWAQKQSWVYMPSSSGMRPMAVSWGTGPTLECVPRYQMLWDTSAQSINAAHDVTRQFLLTYGELSAMSENGDGWIKEAVEFVRDHSGLDGPQADIKKVQDELDKRASNALGSHTFETHDIRESTVSWPLLRAMDINGGDLALPNNKKADTVMVDIRATLHRKTGRILRLTSQPFLYPGKPFFDLHFHKRSGRGFSVGLAKILEQQQVAATTIFNQGIDAQTRANSVWAKTKYRDMIDQPIDPSKMVFDPQGDGVTPFDLKGNDFGNLQLLQFVQAISERLSGQSDPAFGRETRLGGHSAPATTTLALLEQGESLAGPHRGLLRKQLGKLGEFISTLNQQFEVDESKLRNVMGAKDAADASSLAFPSDPIPGNFKFQVVGLSRADNPDREIQKQVQIDQQNNNYWGNVIRITEAWTKVVSQVQDPEIQMVLREAYTQYLRSSTKTYERFLYAAEVDDVENFLLTIEDTRDGEQATQSFNSLADRARETLGNGAAGQAPGGMVGPGGGADPLPSGVPGDPGGPMPQ